MPTSKASGLVVTRNGGIESTARNKALLLAPTLAPFQGCRLSLLLLSGKVERDPYSSQYAIPNNMFHSLFHSFTPH